MSIAPGDWNGWGFDSDNSHFQTKPELAAADVPKLKLKWAFGFPKEVMAFAQPTVVGGRLFIGSNAGVVYSLNAQTGCIYWTYKVGRGVRTAITVAKLPSGKWAAFFGDIQAHAHAVDAETGAPLWDVKLDDHPVARVTGAPTFANGKVYVPMSSVEEVQYGNSECCKFRGSVSSLDAATGKVLWKSYSVLDPPKATAKKNKNGVQMYGPAGAAVWSSPTVDLKRKVIYAATGNSYTEVEINTSDSIVAFDLETGRMLWSSQVTPKDNFIVGCPVNPNCPEGSGPDFDFGSSPILRTLPDGKQILIAGQKSGVVWGLDPDNRGKILWQTRVGKGSALGGIEWGHAADDKNTYAAVSDRFGAGGTPGIYALELATGKQVWAAPAPKVGGNGAQSAAVAVIPGAVFSGALNGHFRAYSTATGEIVWDFETAKPFETVNGVPAKGGSIDAPGPVIAHGMVYTNSGYGLFGGVAGNVLLAFSVDGK
jgi:polyvinyl alcohol dehydrogenase (cytochrome)